MRRLVGIAAAGLLALPGTASASTDGDAIAVTPDFAAAATVHVSAGRGDGDDRLQGSDAHDTLTGGRGADLIRTDDRSADDVDCAGGLDVAIVDRRVRGCEIVEGGRLRVRVAGRSAAVHDGSARIALRCVGTPRCHGRVTVLRGRTLLGRGPFAIMGRRVAAARIGLNARGRRLAARGVRVSLCIDAHDARGNGRRTRTTIRLTAPR